MELTINEAILKVIKAQFAKVCGDLNVTNYKIFDEQDFAIKGVEDNMIYIITTSKRGTDFYKSSVVPVEINIISEQNTLEMAKIIADTYGSEFTLENPIITIENAYIQQAYTTPEVKTNFEEIDNGFRSVVSFEGTFAVAFDIQSVQSIIIDGETLNITSLRMHYTNAPDPQPFYATDARTRTINKFGTLVINFSMVSVDCVFLRKVNAMSLGLSTINSDFLVSLSLGSQTLLNNNMKLIDWSYQQNKGEIPQVSITLTR